MSNLGNVVTRILHLDDNQFDGELVAAQLKKSKFPCTITFIQTEDAFRQALSKCDFDIILCDYKMPLFNGDQAFALAREQCPDIPFILVTGELGEEFVIERLHQGVTDYILKDNMKRLSTAIERALEEAAERQRLKEAENRLRESEERLRFHVENSPLAVVEWDDDFYVTRWSKEAEQLFGWTASEVIGRRLNTLNMIFPPDIPVVARTSERLAAGKERTVISSNRNVTKTGRIIECVWYNSVLVDADGKMRSVMSLVLDVTERKNAEEALRRSEERFKSIFDQSPIGIAVYDAEGCLIELSTSAVAIYGLKNASSLRGSSLFSSPTVTNEEREELRQGRIVHRELVYDFDAMRAANIADTTRTGTAYFDRIIAPLVDRPSGRLYGYLAQMQDITKRKKIEESLLASERQHRLLFEHLFEAFCYCEMIYDANGRPVDYRFLITNEKFEEMSTFKDVVGKLVTEVIPGVYDAHPEMFETYGRVARTGQAEQFEMYFSPTDRWFAVSAYSPEPGHVAIIFDNITNRKRAENALLISEQRLRVFFESDMMGAIYWTMDGEIIDANDKFLQMVGYSREDLNAGAVRWSTMTPPEYDDADNFAIAALKATGVDTPYEKEYIRKDGKRIPILIGAAMLDERRHEGVAFVLDISERKKAEQALREAQRRQQLLAEIVSGLLQTNDPQGIVSELCRKALPITGCDVFFNFLVEPGGKFLELNAYAGVPDEVAQSIQRLDFEAAVCGFVAQHGSRMIAEHIPTTPDPRTDLIRSLGIKAYCCHPLYEQGGKVIGTLSFGSKEKETFTEDDVALMKTISDHIAIAMSRVQAKALLEHLNADLEARVRERTEELSRANNELSSFAHTVTHDLRAPLRAIAGYSTILEEEQGTALDQQGKEILANIQNSVAGMSRLIDDILAFSRSERQEIISTRVPMGEIFNTVIHELRRNEPSDRDIQIVMNDLPDAAGDIALIRQVIANLVGNAMKFTRGTPRTRIEIGSSVSRGRETYFVRDNGAGFDPQYKDQLFQVFQRLHAANEFEGTGVGLAFCKRIIERHGGTMWAEGELGKGATFYFSLPVLAQPEENAKHFK